MGVRVKMPLRTGFAAAAVAIGIGTAHAAEVKVMAANAVKEACVELVLTAPEAGAVIRKTGMEPGG